MRLATCSLPGSASRQISTRLPSAGFIPRVCGLIGRPCLIAMLPACRASLMVSSRSNLAPIFPRIRRFFWLSNQVRWKSISIDMCVCASSWVYPSAHNFNIQFISPSDSSIFTSSNSTAFTSKSNSHSRINITNTFKEVYSLFSSLRLKRELEFRSWLL